jgi:hypothetical protein
MKHWAQVGGDVNPKEYGAILAREEPGGVPWSAGGRHGISQASVEIVQIDTDDERGRGYYVSTAYFYESDLKWGGKAHAEKIAPTSGYSKAEWNRLSLVDRAVAAIGYYGSGWSDETGGRRVEKWSEALPAKSNQIKWWR